jgi:4-hydroxy-tetrahydrodipicolinate synthase
MLSISTNPIPIKTAAAILGMASDELRLPMVALEEAQKAKLKAMLKDYGLLEE